MQELCSMNCTTCHEGAATLKSEEVKKYLDQLDLGWEVNDDQIIHRHFRFRNFAGALDFVNKVGEIAQQQGHHPDISFGWGKVDVYLTTHKAGGLTINDLIMAARIDNISETPR